MQQSFIQHLLSNVTLDSDRVLEIVDTITGGNTSELMRIMSYLSGYSAKPEVPETSTYREQAKLVSYNFVTDEVYFEHLESRVVRVSEEQKDLDGTVYKAWYDIPTSVRADNGNTKITIKYWSNGKCSLANWLQK